MILYRYKKDDLFGAFLTKLNHEHLVLHLNDYSIDDVVYSQPPYADPMNTDFIIECVWGDWGTW